jgi:hypothetical protein
MPLIEMVEMPWGTQFVPVDELERLVSRVGDGAGRGPRPRDGQRGRIEDAVQP